MRARTRGPRSFDAVAVGQRETDAWVAYYRHEWVAFLRASVGMVAAGFGMNRRDTLRGAWLVLRANQAWAPFPDNDPDRARELMRQFYALVASSGGLDLDPTRAAALEVEWWRVHRAHQHDDDVTTETSWWVRSAPSTPTSMRPTRDLVRPAATRRVEAMDLSDAWVRSGCSLTDPLLSQERRALVASYAALLDAVGRSRT